MLVRALSVSATLFVLLFFAHKLPEETNGSFSSFWVQTGIFVAIAGLGLPVFVYTYNREKLSQILYFLPPIYKRYYVLWVLAVSGVFCFVQLASNTLFPVNFWNILCLVGYISCLSVSYIYEALSIIYGYYKRLLWASVLCNALSVCLYILFYWGNITASELLFLLMWNAVLRLLLLEHQRFNFGYRAPVDLASVQRHWKTIGVYDLSQNVIKYLDKFILSLLLAKESFAMYYVITTEIPIFAIVFSSVKSTVSMHLSYGHTQAAHLSRYLRLVGRMLGFFIIPAVIYIVFFTKDIITLVYSQKYLEGWPIFIVAVLKMLNYNFVFSAVLQSFEKGKLINNGVWIDCIVSLILLWPFYYFWGLMGVALSVLVSTAAQITYYTYHSKLLLHVGWMHLLPLRAWGLQVLFFALLTGMLKWALGFLSGPYWLPMTLSFVPIAIIALWYIYKSYLQVKRY